MSEDDDIDAMVAGLVGRKPMLPATARPEVVADNRERAIRAATPGLGVPVAVAHETGSGVAGLSALLSAELARNATPAAPIDPRTVPVRFSSLKNMAASPLHYLDAVRNGREDTFSMRIGRGAHALSLRQPIVEYTRVRNGRAWEQFRAANADKEILNSKEYSIAMGMHEAIAAHRDASEILFGPAADPATLEETIHWEFMGRACTSRPDSRRGTDIVTDLKTTQCAEPVKFARDATFRLYHGQLDFYGAAIEARFGKRPDHTFCVAVESKRPHAVTVLELTKAALAEGQRCWRLWFERLLVCEASNHWPAYSDAIEPFDVLESAGDLTLTIDGEDYTYDEDGLP